MTPLEAGAPLPDLTIKGPDGPVRLHDAAAQGPLVIAFYQEDATPVCTAQLGAFRDDFDLIAEAGARLLAISADDRTSQEPASRPRSRSRSRSSATPGWRPRARSAWSTIPAGAACARSS